jgi:hypothetical protein
MERTLKNVTAASSLEEADDILGIGGDARSE